jgi:succinate dehydrogenase (ubiquinone) cytochrome b560 subunit
MMRRVLTNVVAKKSSSLGGATASRPLATIASKKDETYTQRQNKTGRPVSPHVTIYRFPIAAVSSVLNRGTGMALTAGEDADQFSQTIPFQLTYFKLNDSQGVAGIGGLTLAGIDVPALMTFIGNYPLVGMVGKFAVAFPLSYHYLGGLRHVIWDYYPEKTLNNDDVEKSSYAIIAAATVIGAGAALV